MRRAVGGEPNPQEYEQKQAQLTELKRLTASRLKSIQRLKNL